MKQRIITLIIILLTFFSILSANYQVLNKLNIGEYLYSKTIFTPKHEEISESNIEEKQECYHQEALPKLSNFTIPVRLVIPFYH